MKKNIYYLVLVIGVCFFGACSTTPDDVRTDPWEAPEAIYPRSGGAGEPVSITGEGFGTDPNGVNVLVGPVSAFVNVPADPESEPVIEPAEAQIISVSDTKIHFLVPSGTPSYGEFAEGEELIIVVLVGGEYKIACRLFYLASPKIVSLDAPENAYTRLAVLNGYRFSPVAEENIVRFGGVEAKVISAQQEKLVVEIPLLTSTTHQVTVRVGEYTSGPVVYLDNQAQTLHNKDSVIVTNFDWEVKPIADGVVWKHGYMELSGKWRNVNIVEADPQQTTLKIGYTDYTTGGMKKTSTLCEDGGAIAGINAGYFTYSSLTVSPYSGPYDALRIDGVDIVNGAEHRVGATFLSGLMAIVDNRLLMFQLPNSERNAAASNNYSAEEYPTIMAAGPILALEGRRIAFPSLEVSDDHFTVAHPRTAIGVKSDGTFILMTVDGRRDTADPQMVGMSTAMLGNFMRYIGSEAALNLDGGGSTAMYVRNEGIVNYPSDGSERSVASIVYVAPNP